MNHSPAPWKKEGVSAVRSADGKRVCLINCRYSDPSRWAADADLIEVAPELLEVLKAFAQQSSNLIARFNGARAHRMDADIGKEMIEDLENQARAAIAKAERSRRGIGVTKAR